MKPFHLRLTPSEEYMLHDDRPTHPMSIWMRLRLRGRMDAQRLERALAAGVQRHPLLGCLVNSRGPGQHYWELQPANQPTIASHTAAPGEYPTASAINLAREVGLRTWLRQAAEESEIFWQFHHTAVDGMGAFQFVADVLKHYAGDDSVPSSSVADSVATLQGRNQFGLTTWKLLKMAPAQATGLLGAREFLSHRPVPLTPHDGQLAAENPHEILPTALSASLTTEETTRLRQAARSRQVTMNDLLIRDLLLALFAWRAARGLARDDDWLRLSVPMNLRTPEASPQSGTNVVSMVFIDRQPPRALQPDELLQSIHDQMALIKRRQLGLTFIFSLHAARWLPGGIRKTTAGNNCLATSVITNLGEPLAGLKFPQQDGKLLVNELLLEDLEVLAPLRPQTQVAFSAWTYAGCLKLALHYDRRIIEADQARDLHQRFLLAVRDSLRLSDSARSPAV